MIYIKLYSIYIISKKFTQSLIVYYVYIIFWLVTVFSLGFIFIFDLSLLFIIYFLYQLEELEDHSYIVIFILKFF